MVIAALIGTLSSVFLSEEKTKREYEKEKLEKDERYINNRKTFSYYLFIVLALTIPIVLIVLNLYGIEQISISSLTIIFLIFCFAYMIVLEIIRKKSIILSKIKNIQLFRCMLPSIYQILVTMP